MKRMSSQRLLDHLAYVLKHQDDGIMYYFRDSTDPRKDVDAIAKVIQHPMNLVELLLISSWMDTESLRFLCGDQGLVNPNCRVSTLVFQNHAFGMEKAEIVRDLLCHPRNNIRCLEIRSGRLSSDELCVLAEGLKHPNNITTSLNLSGNPIGDKGGKILADLLNQTHCRITELNVNQTGMEGKGLALLAVGLRKSQICSFTLSAAVPNDAPVMMELRNIMEVLGSKWMRVIVTLLSANCIPRLGKGSKMTLPGELIRIVARTLPITKPPPPNPFAW